MIKEGHRVRESHSPISERYLEEEEEEERRERKEWCLQGTLNGIRLLDVE